MSLPIFIVTTLPIFIVTICCYLGLLNIFGYRFSQGWYQGLLWCDRKSIERNSCINYDGLLPVATRNLWAGRPDASTQFRLR